MHLMHIFCQHETGRQYFWYTVALSVLKWETILESFKAMFAIVQQLKLYLLQIHSGLACILPEHVIGTLYTLSSVISHSELHLSKTPSVAF